MESVYWLSGETRSKVIEQLAKNNGILFQYATNNEVVASMMAQNKQLVEKLSSLLIRPAATACNLVQSPDDASVRPVNGTLANEPVNHHESDPVRQDAKQDDSMHSNAPANQKQVDNRDGN